MCYLLHGQKLTLIPCNLYQFCRNVGCHQFMKCLRLEHTLHCGYVVIALHKNSAHETDQGFFVRKYLWRYEGSTITVIASLIVLQLNIS